MFILSLARGIVLAVPLASTIALAQSATPLPQTAAATPSGPPAVSAETQVAVDQRIRMLQTQLGITEAQIPLWSAFAQAMRENAAATDALFTQRAGAVASMNATENMHSYAQIARAYADNTERLATAFDSLYASLSDTQKQAADTLFRQQASASPPDARPPLTQISRRRVLLETAAALDDDAQNPSEGPMANGILLAAMDFSAAPEDEFHDWYDLEHVPERLRVPGFLNGERWIGASSPKISVATYDLDNVGVLKSPPYLAIAGENSSPWTKRTARFRKSLMRYEGEQLFPGDRTAPPEAAALLVIAMNIAPEHESDFNEWYNIEHIPALGAVPGTLCARRYRGMGATQRYVALYHFASPEVPSSAEWRKAANTPWTQRLRPHFRDMVRFDCRRYTRAS